MLLDRKRIFSISEKLCFESLPYFTKAFNAKVEKIPTKYKKDLL